MNELSFLERQDVSSSEDGGQWSTNRVIFFIHNEMKTKSVPWSHEFEKEKRE